MVGHRCHPPKLTHMCTPNCSCKQVSSPGETTSTESLRVSGKRSRNSTQRRTLHHSCRIANVTKKKEATGTYTIQSTPTTFRDSAGYVGSRQATQLCTCLRAVALECVCSWMSAVSPHATSLHVSLPVVVHIICADVKRVGWQKAKLYKISRNTALVLVGYSQ
ncbi:hypothetical protein PISMIDRAFT_353515 [Pisolithus microcarpus 441]|uniref:Uncharacterized protein n=1 Tax=Pisolithus microcarpus 441 TaxID=765257 RepID=A0A0C9Z7A0_9AGAM|nr:hypothetical protein PISMIDRAFT_353515 [Pisolithus microcarpus 441]